MARRTDKAWSLLLVTPQAVRRNYSVVTASSISHFCEAKKSIQVSHGLPQEIRRRGGAMAATRTWRPPTLTNHTLGATPESWASFESSQLPSHRRALGSRTGPADNLPWPLVVLPGTRNSAERERTALEGKRYYSEACAPPSPVCGSQSPTWWEGCV